MVAGNAAAHGDIGKHFGFGLRPRSRQQIVLARHPARTDQGLAVAAPVEIGRMFGDPQVVRAERDDYVGEARLLGNQAVVPEDTGKLEGFFGQFAIVARRGAGQRNGRSLGGKQRLSSKGWPGRGLRRPARCVSPNRMWSEEFERRAAEMRQRNDRERLASRIGHDQLRIAEAVGINGAMERHYTVQEIGELWKLSANTVTRLFRDEPGILKLGSVRWRRGRRSYGTSASRRRSWSGSTGD